MNKKNIMMVLNVLIIILLLCVSLCGLLSFDNNYAYETVNQYGDTIKMWGAGIYGHDSYFKAPIFIGTDFTVLVCIVPLSISVLWKLYKEKNIEHYIQSFALMSFVLYYSTSIAFGVTYNSLHLVYIFLFGASFYFTAMLFLHLYKMDTIHDKICHYTITKGMKIFLLVAGVSLFVAWLPDILSALMHNSTLELIEVYTTEITYVLDMGIISPLMLIAFFQARKNSFIGYVLIRMLFVVCIGVGIMLPLQTVFQVLSGINIPIPAFITKLLIFVIMALFALLFNYRITRETHYIS